MAEAINNTKPDASESVTLSAIGGAAGLALARLGVRALLRFVPNDALSPLDLNLAPDGRLLGFAFAISIVSGIVFGLAPALRASRQDPLMALKSDAASFQVGRGARWDLGRTLVSLQVALSLLLLAGAGLFARTLSNMRSLDLGLNRANVLFIDTNMTQTGYPPSWPGPSSRACANRSNSCLASGPRVWPSAIPSAIAAGESACRSMAVARSRKKRSSWTAMRCLRDILRRSASRFCEASTSAIPTTRQFPARRASPS